MIALIAGTGELPNCLVEELAKQDVRPLICELEGFPPEVPSDLERIRFRLERIGGLLVELQRRGVTEVCLAGGIRRPKLRATAFDLRTITLLPRILKALRTGDDTALRIVIGLFEGAGIAVRAAHEIAPELLMPEGCPTVAQPTDLDRSDAMRGQAVLAEMGAADTGQACIIADGDDIRREGPDGTDAMIRSVQLGGRGLLFKGPKPQQDRRADLPVIGPETVASIVAAGLRGIVIEAGGVMVLDQQRVIADLDAAGLFLWVRAPE